MSMGKRVRWMTHMVDNYQYSATARGTVTWVSDYGYTVKILWDDGWHEYVSAFWVTTDP